MFGRTIVAVVCVPACGDNVSVVRPDAASPDATSDSSADGAPSSVELVASWGGYGTQAGQFVEPSSVELDTSGFVYVAGHENRVQKFTPAGDLVLIWGTPGAGDGQFNHPHGLAVDRARGDVIYVGDQENRRVQAFMPDGAFVRRWEDTQFQHIHDVGIDPATGDIYIGDYEADIIQKFSATGTELAELGAPGTGPGQFDGVWGISTDSAGNLYVADTFNRRVQKLDNTGAFVAEWTSAGGTALMKPTGVFVDQADQVYLCDSVAETVYVLSTDGVLIDRWNLREILGTRSEPEDIVLDSAGANIYIAEVYGHRVYRLRPTL